MNTYLTDASVHVPELRERRAPTYDEIAERALELCARSIPSAAQRLEAWVESEQQTHPGSQAAQAPTPPAR